ncbi:hypothetical protein, partial [Brucella abortus]|uniref:hypothetical protein n=1 Tax=Brucella abortus TaxID=235 RepID=UPI00196A8B43
ARQIHRFFNAKCSFWVANGFGDAIIFMHVFNPLGDIFHTYPQGAGGLGCPSESSIFFKIIFPAEHIRIA